MLHLRYSGNYVGTFALDIWDLFIVKYFCLHCLMMNPSFRVVCGSIRCCLNSKSNSKSTDRLINSLNAGSFLENDPCCLSFCSLKRDVEQFISSLQHPCVLVWLGLIVSEYWQSIYFASWLIFRSDPDVFLKTDIPSRYSQLGWIVLLSMVHH